MSIFATQPEQKEREIVKAGTHPAYLYRIVYLGTQSRVFEGKEIQSQKVWLDFELPKEVVEYEDEKTKEKKSFVRSLGAEYTLSLHEKGKLLPMIQGWLGRSLTNDEMQSFDVCTLLGRPAFVTVKHEEGKGGKMYANLAGVAPVMEGYTMPKMVNKIIEIGKDQWGSDDFNALPEFLRKKVEESNEWKLMNKAVRELTDDDIPVIEPEKDMTMHQGDNQTDSNGAKLEEAPF